MFLDWRRASRYIHSVYLYSYTRAPHCGHSCANRNALCVAYVHECPDAYTRCAADFYA